MVVAPYMLGENGQYTEGVPTGTEIFAVFYIPGIEPIIMGTIDTLSYSSHRDKIQVRICGHGPGPVGKTRGNRTVAGTLIFKTFGGAEIKQILVKTYPNNGYESALADVLPLFNIVVVIPTVSYPSGSDSSISYANAYTIALYGVDIIDQKATFSVDDIIPEQVYSYMANDIEDYQPLTSGGQYSNMTDEQMRYVHIDADRPEQALPFLDDFNQRWLGSSKHVELPNLRTPGSVQKSPGLYWKAIYR